jgi:hypothetical protein
VRIAGSATRQLAAAAPIKEATRAILRQAEYPVVVDHGAFGDRLAGKRHEQPRTAVVGLDRQDGLIVVPVIKSAKAAHGPQLAAVPSNSG